MEAVNGVRSFGVNTEYRKRDILIVDHSGKRNTLLKDAYYAGNSSVFGTPDGGATTRFQAYVYFEYMELEKLCLLPITSKVSKIKLYSKPVSNLIGYPSLTIKSSDTDFTVNLSREDCSKSIDINTNPELFTIIHLTAAKAA